MATPERDTGTGYERKPSTYNAELTEVGRGTPMGELMRRYWHPDRSRGRRQRDTPQRVRVLGEDLILFRDGEGRPGLRLSRAAATAARRSITARSRSAASAAAITAGCSTSKATAWSSRASPSGGQHRETRAPALVSGRGALRPGVRLSWARPRRSRCCRATNASRIWRRASSSRPTIPASAAAASRSSPCNWLQHFENVLDPLPRADPARLLQRRAVRRADGGSFPKVKLEYTATGVKARRPCAAEDGKRTVASPRFRADLARRAQPAGGRLWRWNRSAGRCRSTTRISASTSPGASRRKANSASSSRATTARLAGADPEEHQNSRATPRRRSGRARSPSIPRSTCHLRPGRRHAARLLQRQLDAVAAGRDPAGVSFDRSAPPVVFEAGNYIMEKSDQKVAEVLNA